MDINKLMMAKAIMDKTNQMDSSGQKPQQRNNVQLENFNLPNAKYNIPQEMLSETPVTQQPVVTKFMNQGYPQASVSAIEKSRLPDEIKKLMIEHPIEQPNGHTNVTLSDELIEKAARLMGTNGPSKIQEEQIPRQPITESIPNNTTLKKMLKEVVKEVLKENGVIAESSERANDLFTFKVGKHIFEGKLTKIKKLS